MTGADAKAYRLQLRMRKRDLADALDCSFPEVGRIEGTTGELPPAVHARVVAALTEFRAKRLAREEDEAGLPSQMRFQRSFLGLFKPLFFKLGEALDEKTFLEPTRHDDGVDNG